jgi:hypothetical protein
VPQAPVLLSDSTPPQQGQTQCNDGLDNDGDGKIDIFAPGGNEALGDTGCATADDNSESVGVPAGTTLTAYTGPYTITTDGTVIDSKDITQPITIAANNVTIRKSRLRNAGSGVSQTLLKTPVNATNYGVLVEDSEFDGGGVDGSSSPGTNYCIFHNDGSLAQTSFTLRRSILTRCGDMFGMGNSTVIDNNYWYNSWTPPGGHGDGLEMNGGQHQHAHHNVILGEYSTASVAWGDYYSHVQDILFERNYVGGAPARLILLGSGNGGGVDYWRFAYNRLKCSIGWYGEPGPAGVFPATYPAGNSALNDHLTWTGNTCAATSTIWDAPLTNFPSAGWVKACANGYDDDNDGAIDTADSGCSSSSDNLE